MPVETAKRTVKKACRSIQRHWTADEALRRREAAEEMQNRLVAALGLRPMAPR